MSDSIFKIIKDKTKSKEFFITPTPKNTIIILLLLLLLILEEEESSKERG
jgi:hypothetical protein